MAGSSVVNSLFVTIWGRKTPGRGRASSGKYVLSGLDSDVTLFRNNPIYVQGHTCTHAHPCCHPRFSCYTTTHLLSCVSYVVVG